MADIVLKNKRGEPVTYEGITTVSFDTPEEDVQAVFSEGVAAHDVPIALDFSEGNQKVEAPTGQLVKSAIILKPDTLMPEHIKKGVEVAGVVGTAVGETEEIEVELSMADGNQVILPPNEDVGISKVTVIKPETLVPENIVKGVEIAGVVGTLEGGGGASADVRYVTFMNGDVELYKKPVAVGDDCVDVVKKGLIPAPEKESTAQYDYTYAGWSTTPGGAADSNALKSVTENRTVYAAYTGAVRSYTITYYDSDGVAVLKTEQVAYGSVPDYVPTKSGVAFDGWTPTPAAVTEDASYTATWVTVVSSGTFTGGMSGGDPNMTWILYPDGKVVISGTGATPNYGAANTRSPLYSWRNTITRAEVEEGVTGIGDALFAYCENLESITIANSVTHIGIVTFYKCSGLTSATFKNTAGWWVTNDKNATSGTAVDVSDPAANAVEIKANASRYWRRS